MHRRDFVKTTIHAAAAGGVISICPCSSLAADSPARDSATAAVLKSYTATDHLQRLQNISICTHKIRTCMRNHLVTNYLPGHCCYNLGEYPCRKPWEIGEYDEHELDQLKDVLNKLDKRKSVKAI